MISRRRFIGTGVMAAAAAGLDGRAAASPSDRVRVAFIGVGNRGTQLLERFREARKQMIAWVAGLEDAALERTGRHPFLGVSTLREMIKMIYIHNQTHYRDIRRVLKG